MLCSLKVSVAYLRQMWKTQKEPISRSTWSSILLYWCTSPESACGGASYTHLLSLPTQHGNSRKRSPLQRSQFCTWSQLGALRTAFLTVSWQLWMECAYVEGRRDRRGNDVGLLENTCIIMFTSGSFLQMTCTIQQQIPLYVFFFHCSFGFLWNHQFSDFHASS